MSDPRIAMPFERPKMFGRFAWLEAEVLGLERGFNRHLDDCSEDRKEDQRRYDALLKKIDDNATACIAKAEGVRQDLSDKIWLMLWKLLAGVGALILFLAGVMHWHASL